MKKLLFLFIGIFLCNSAFAQTGTVTDINGNVYQTIKIGDLEWMAENLKVTKYRNGDSIPNVTSNSEWISLLTGAYAAYDNNATNVSTYGYLYNWYAVDDSLNIAPEGWHVATEEEWSILVEYLGDSIIAGGKLKEAGTSHWNIPNAGATNESGFTALPGGYRNDKDGDGAFSSIGYYALFWSSTEYVSQAFVSHYAWHRRLSYDNSDVARDYTDRQGGFSVRCVRDADADSSGTATIEIISHPDSTQVVTLTNDSATVKVTYTDGSSVTISFKTGNVAGQTLTIEKLSSIPNEAVNNQQFSSTVGIYDISLDVSSFSADLTFGYSDSALNASGISEDNLGASFYDSTDGRGFIWHSVPVTPDKDNNTIRMSTSHFSLWALVDINDALITDVTENENEVVPNRFELMQNYPNPFNPETTIRFELPTVSNVTLKIYNIRGQEVKTLVSKHMPAGFHNVVWDGTNNSGRHVSTGMYIYQLIAGEFSSVKKMLFIK